MARVLSSYGTEIEMGIIKQLKDLINESVDAETLVADSLLEFKVLMLKHEPFYGDVLMRLNISADRSVETACTNGRWIKYNPDFMASLKPSQRNYILLHEMLHVLFKHWKRQGDRDPRLWNIACDMVVNNYIDRRMMWFLTHADISIERPAEGVFVKDYIDRNVEDIYQELYNKINKGKKGKGGKIELHIFSTDVSISGKSADLILSETGGGPGSIEEQIAEKQLDNMLRSAMSKAAGRGRCPIPDMKIELTESKRLPWNRILADFLEDKVSEESSYFTPERKYLHMDMIVPGLGTVEDDLADLWAFVDTSGSIGGNELNQFITQLYRIGRQFNCHINLAYWDTAVGKVYKNIRNTKELLESAPDSSGGTDINCVYDYIRENKIKPGVLIILTDGYFGRCNEPVGSLKKKTIIVLSEDSYDKDAKEMGVLARL